MSTYRRFEVTVISVHDGDTFTGVVDVGFGLTLCDHVRLLGINAPELSTGDPGKKSTDRLKELIEGKHVLCDMPMGRDKYGRLLGIVYDKVTMDNINQRMLNEGNAVKFMAASGPDEPEKEWL